MNSFTQIQVVFKHRKSTASPMIRFGLAAIGFFLCTSVAGAHAAVLTPIEEGFPVSVVNPSHVLKPSTPPPSVPFEKSEAMSWKTEHVGRVQMNFPVNRPRSWSNEFDMAVVKRLPEMTPEVFWQGVDFVRQRYENQKHRKYTSRLAHYEKAAGNAAFVFHYESPNSFWAPTMRRFIHLDNLHAYEMRTGSLDTPNEPPTPPIFASSIKEYAPIFNRIHPLKEGQAPNRDGLAIDGAVVSGETGRNAVAGLSVEIAFGTNLSLSYRENNYQVEIRSPFEELALDESHARKMAVYDDPRAVREFKIVRRQERTLAGIAGQEFIAKTTLKNGHFYYNFRWGVKGSNDGGVLQPRMTILLQTPEYPNASPGEPPYTKLLPEPELIKLWEFALATFKWRTGALPDGLQIKAVN